MDLQFCNVGVIGAGQMGAGIAQVAALAGAHTVVTDVSEARLEVGRGAIHDSLRRMVKKDRITKSQMEQALERVGWSTELATHADRELVVEAINEDEQLKVSVLSDLETVCKPDAVLASNTSSISITRLASCLQRPDRFVGMHFMNPVPMMKLVELIRGAATSDATCKQVEQFASQLGKTTTVSQDFPGFISNRILMPMINEAFFALLEGIGSASDIDKTLTTGMGHPMGPLALADLIGLDTCLSIMEILHREFGDSKYRPCPLLRRFVAAKWLGRKTKRGVFIYD